MMRWECKGTHSNHVSRQALTLWPHHICTVRGAIIMAICIFGSICGREAILPEGHMFQPLGINDFDSHIKLCFSWVSGLVTLMLEKVVISVLSGPIQGCWGINLAVWPCPCQPSPLSCHCQRPYTSPWWINLRRLHGLRPVRPISHPPST